LSLNSCEPFLLIGKLKKMKKNKKEKQNAEGNDEILCGFRCGF
jgi:hypothetical protein